MNLYDTLQGLMRYVGKVSGPKNTMAILCLSFANILGWWFKDFKMMPLFMTDNTIAITSFPTVDQKC